MFSLFANKRIYLDYASATPVLPGAIAAMREAEGLIGNPGAIHSDGVAAKAALEKARSVIAEELACKSREVVFTSGLTESNNLAILGVARALEHGGRIAGSHWIVSSIEHDAVLESFAEVERLGGTVTHIHPDKKGIITADAIAHAVRPETVLVSIGWANNEIGVVQPLRAISRAVREKTPSTLIHSDAGQGPLYISPQVHTLGVDLFSLGSNKLYGPHGVGALYISNAAHMAAILHGGKQERGLRPGTENVALATGFAAAVKAISAKRDTEKHRLEKMRNDFVHEVQILIPDAVINGHSDFVLPHIASISIPNVDAEYVTLALDKSGFAVSTKSACREGEESESHVVAALVADIPSEKWRAQNTIRFSFGRDTSSRDLMKAACAVKKCADLSRAQKPV